MPTLLLVYITVTKMPPLQVLLVTLHSSIYLVGTGLAFVLAAVADVIF